ncbi:MAG: chemotaxis protein CheA [Deltaproteobacteria bacterium]|nr:chemotaxis protein CheA [Deltaproteobacteria bacterium]
MSLDLAQAFFEEAAELLADFETSLLHLEESPGDPEILNRIFRCAHTLKGNGAMLGFDEVAHFTHALEDLLDRLRKGEMAVTPVVVDTLLESLDAVKQLIAAAKGNDEQDAEQCGKILQVIRALIRGEMPADAVARPSTTAGSPRPSATVAGRQILYEIQFTPPRDAFQRGLDPIHLLQDLSGLGEFVQVTAETSDIPDLDSMDPECCYLAWKIWLLSRGRENDIKACFDFLAESGAISIDAHEMDENGMDETEGRARTSHEPSTVGNSAWGIERELSIANPAESRTAESEVRSSKRETLESSSIRVSTEKIDKLVNLVGEIVIVQSMINEVVRDFSPDKLDRLQEAVTDMERNTRELQERVMAVRMLPIGNVFGRFPRLVRDLATAFGKKVTLQITGEETELDKGVIERIGDPLTHLIRNAVDHGIDSPEERRQAGKPESGVIRLHAFHRGGNVIIDVIDDGRGLNGEKIGEKALALGLIRPDENLTEEQIHSLIFRPGFSTAAVVSDVSGRGVGMDVVKRNVEALNGTVAISSERGKGTRFRIKLPLTLAILDGLSLRVGEEIYIIPLIAIVESIRPRPDSLRTVFGRGEVIGVRGEYLSLLRLHRVFNAVGQVSGHDRGLVVIVENEGEKIGVLVDELLGQQQVVIKSLESNFKKMDGIAGATVLGDGRVALILDVPGLVGLARQNLAAA